MTRLQQIQTLLGVPADDRWGAKSSDALNAEIRESVMRRVATAKVLPSLLPWTAEIDGEDLVIRNGLATCFGGAYDAGDSGQTESGILNDGSDPRLFGVALPIRSTEAATRQSPLAFKGPHIPWETHVWVWREKDGPDRGVDALLIDNGPNVLKFPTHAIDCNPAVALHFSPGFDPRKIANAWSMAGMSCRIIGAAKYIS